MKKIIIIVCLFLFLNPTLNVHAQLHHAVVSQLGNDYSVSIRSLETGEVIFQKNGDNWMKPASTLKLLTAAVALDTLGPNYRFHTKVYIDGTIKDAVLDGDVYIKGQGDPTLQKKNFEAFAKSLKQNGIHRINGNLYGDDSWFSGAQLTPGVATDDESYYYAARTTALTMSPDRDFDAGTMIIHVQPTSVGNPPVISAQPGFSGMVIQNQATTVKGNQKNTIEMTRQYRTNNITISGNIPVGEPFKDWVTLYDPTINTLHAVKETFEKEGITFSNDAKLKRKELPLDAKLVYIKHSLPLETILVPFSKLSNNSIADILMKTLGKEVYGIGDTNYGVKVLRNNGALLGLNMDQWRFEDGSGISHDNRVSANELTNLLVEVPDESYFNLFFESLPVGGEKDRLIGGSLRKRFHDDTTKNRVNAKTGSISGVYTLAGYVKAKSGRTYAFSIMTQNQPYSSLKSIDEVVKNIIENY